MDFFIVFFVMIKEYIFSQKKDFCPKGKNLSQPIYYQKCHFIILSPVSIIIFILLEY